MFANAFIPILFFVGWGHFRVLKRKDEKEEKSSSK